MKKLIVLLFIVAFTFNLLYSQSEIKITAGDGAAGDYFGTFVSISGDYAVSSAHHASNDRGVVYVFKREGNSWIEEAKLTASDVVEGDKFGIPAICGDYLAVGVQEKNNQAGAVYVFKRNGSTWTETQKLTVSDAAANALFGSKIAISDKYLVVSAPWDDVNGSKSGSIYIFKLDGNTWLEQIKLTAGDGQADDRLGNSLSIRDGLGGSLVVAGAYYDDDKGNNAGAAYVFATQLGRHLPPWKEYQKLTANDGETNDAFGYRVSVSGEYLAIGAFGDDDKGNRAGAAYIFKQDGNTWTEQTKLTASDGAELDRFGNAVSISGDRLVIGAPVDDDNGEDSGSIYIFDRDGSNWNETTKLIASDGQTIDYFGTWVSISGNYLIVGANGDDDQGENSGSAYILDFCPAPQNLYAFTGYHNAVPLAWDAPTGYDPLAAFPGGAEQFDFPGEELITVPYVSEMQTDETATTNEYLLDNTLLSYNIYRSNTTGGPYTLIASNVNRQYYRDETVTNGNTYYYVVTTVYDAGESGYSTENSAAPVENGYCIKAGWTETSPTLDGIIDANEWAAATVVDITAPGISQSVTLYVMNSNDRLYLAIDDFENTTFDEEDRTGIYFDVNHDHEWPQSSSSDEGNFWVIWRAAAVKLQYRGSYGWWPGNWHYDPIVDALGIDANISGNSGHVQYEVEINFLNTSAGDIVGFSTYSLVRPENYYSGYWPQEMMLCPFANIWRAPAVFGDLELATEPVIPLLSVTPTTLDFGTTETSLQFQISNTGNGTLTWSVAENPDKPWITSITPGSGTNAATVTVTVDRNLLSETSDTGTLAVTSNGGNQNITVLIAKEIPVLSVTPTTLDFGLESTSKTFQISNTGNGTLIWSVADNANKTWLTSISPANGTNAATVTVTVDRNQLSEASDTGTLAVTSNGGNQDVSVLIAKEVDVLPGHWNFTNTGNNAIIILPTGANPKVEGTPLANGDYVGVFTPAGLCCGYEKWLGVNISVTAWGDNSETTEIDGFQVGELITYRVFRASDQQEWITVEVGYEEGTGLYSVNATMVLNKFEGKATTSCQRGDVNMDDALSSGDALCAFLIYLNGGTPPPDGDCNNECALYAADANCDDAVTSGDALVIFQAYLANLPLPLECPSYYEPGGSNMELSLAQVNAAPGEEITVAVQIDQPLGITAFGLELEYPPELLSFVSISATNLTTDWQMLSGQENEDGVLTMGGFDPEGIATTFAGELVLVTFKVKADAEGFGDLRLFNLTDDVTAAKTGSGIFSTFGSEVRKIGGMEVPTTYVLEQNYPNPFNLETEIVYQLPEAGYVTLSIYNSLGQKIQTLVSRSQSAGKYAARWNGRDEQGLEVSSGIYIYQLETAEFSDLKKLLLVK